MPSPSQIAEQSHKCIVTALGRLGKVRYRPIADPTMVDSVLEVYGITYSVTHAVNYVNFLHTSNDQAIKFHTNDIFFPVHSIEKNTGVEEAGWYVKSQAQLVAYFDVPADRILLYSIPELRADEAMWRGAAKYVAYTSTHIKHTWYGYRLQVKEAVPYEYQRWECEHPMRSVAMIAMGMFQKSIYTGVGKIHHLALAKKRGAAG